MSDCLFCKIIKGEIPSTKVYEDAFTYAFEDISPQAPIHILIISKTHVKHLLEADAFLDDQSLAACLRSCAKVAQLKGLDEKGFRIISNCGKDACQSVDHFHIHVLGGTSLPAQMV